MAADRRDLQSMPGFLIRRAQQIAVAIFMDECAPADITPVQYACLVDIAENPGIDATRLASQVALDRSTLSTVIEKLVVKKLVTRDENPEDRRTRLLTITPLGTALMADITDKVAAAQTRILGPLNPAERTEFMRLLHKLVDLNNESSRAPLTPQRSRAR